MLDSHGGLAVAVLIYYAVLIWPAIYVCVRHGFGRHLGWLYLVTLPIVRIVGASCQIAAEQKPSVGLYTAAAICNGIGLVPLLLTWMGMLKRVNDGLQTRLPVRIFQLTHLITLAGLALSIAGGVKAIPTNSPSEIENGVSIRKGASILFLASFLINFAITMILLLRLNTAWQGDRKIVYAAAASTPFLLVRTVYYILIAFDSHSRTFNAQSPNVYAQAFMQIVMEFIVFAIFLTAGLSSPSTKEAPHTYQGEGPEIFGNRAHKSSPDSRMHDEPELGTIPARA